MNDNDILSLYKNALRLISKGSNQDAEAVIQAIQTEWAERLSKARQGRYKSTTPRVGMLGTLGYSVGQSGVKTKLRRIILDQVVSGELPIVGSPAYTLEWGKPNTKERYRKLLRTLQALKSNGMTRENWDMDKAVIEWAEDIEYIETKYQDTF